MLGAESKAFPDAVFGGDEVGEALADLGEPDEGGHIQDGDLLQDLGDDFLGDAGYWTWWCGREFCGWEFTLDGEAGEFADERLQRGGETM
jgi:hypothetical protein